MPRAPRKSKTITTDAGTMITTPAPPPPPTEILPIPALSKSAITKARELAESIVKECAVVVDTLVVVTPADFHAADELLHKLNVIDKRLDEPFEIIRPVRQGLDRIYAIRREIENPLIDMKTAVKEKMRLYRIEEMKRLDQEEEARRIKQLELEAAERAEAQTLAAQARPASVPMQTDFGSQPYPVPQAIVVPAPYLPPTQPIRAASSSSTKITKWRVHDFALFVKAVTMDMIPLEAVMVDAAKMDEWLKANPAILDSFPGCETYTDFRISGR